MCWNKISTKHVIFFLSKCLSEVAIDVKLSPDVDNNPCSQTGDVRVIM